MNNIVEELLFKGYTEKEIIEAFNCESARPATQEEYKDSILKNYPEEFFEEISYSDKYAEQTTGQKPVIETTGNVYIKYIETDKEIIILGINANKGKLTREDVPDLKKWIELLENKIKEGKTVYTSINDNSRKLINSILRRNPDFIYEEHGNIEWSEGVWVNVSISASKENHKGEKIL